jgi:hypothetical protein
VWSDPAAQALDACSTDQVRNWSPAWVNMRNPHYEQMFSALLPNNGRYWQRSSWATSITARVVGHPAEGKAPRPQHSPRVWAAKQIPPVTRPEAIRGMIDAMLHILAKKDPGEKPTKKKAKVR